MSYMSDYWRRSSEAARSAYLPGRPNDVYARVASPDPDTTPSLITQSGESEASWESRCGASPLRHPSQVSEAPFLVFRATRNPDRLRDHGHTGPKRTDPPQDALPAVTKATSRCAGRSPSPSPSVFTQVRGLRCSPTERPRHRGERGHDNPAPPPALSYMIGRPYP